MPSTPEERQLELPLGESERFLGYADLRRLGVGYSRQHLAALERAGAFPPRLQLSARRVAWRLSDITAWMATRPQAARTPGERQGR